MKAGQMRMNELEQKRVCCGQPDRPGQSQVFARDVAFKAVHDRLDTEGSLKQLLALSGQLVAGPLPIKQPDRMDCSKVLIRRRTVE